MEKVDEGVLNSLLEGNASTLVIIAIAALLAWGAWLKHKNETGNVESTKNDGLLSALKDMFASLESKLDRMDKGNTERLESLTRTMRDTHERHERRLESLDDKLVDEKKKNEQRHQELSMMIGTTFKQAEAIEAKTNSIIDRQHELSREIKDIYAEIKRNRA